MFGFKKNEKQMRISEAIRIGAKKTRQVYGKWFGELRYDPQGNVIGGEACAMATALIGVGQKDQNRNCDKYWPWLNIHKPPCPACGMSMSSVTACVIHLNDKHRWSRETIAAWLEPKEICMEKENEMVREELGSTNL